MFWNALTDCQTVFFRETIVLIKIKYLEKEGSKFMCKLTYFCCVYISPREKFHGGTDLVIKLLLSCSILRSFRSTEIWQLSVGETNSRKNFEMSMKENPSTAHILVFISTGRCIEQSLGILRRRHWKKKTNVGPTASFILLTRKMQNDGISVSSPDGGEEVARLFGIATSLKFTRRLIEPTRFL